jgi:hypothetical protein
MHLELTDEQAEALIRELSQIIDGDREFRAAEDVRRS